MAELHVLLLVIFCFVCVVELLAEARMFLLVDLRSLIRFRFGGGAFFLNLELFLISPEQTVKLVR